VNLKLNKRQSNSALGLWIAIGAGTGIVLGSAFDNSGYGLVFGAAIGVALGTALNQRSKGSNSEDDA
jgi:hypothetical protein